MFKFEKEKDCFGWRCWDMCVFVGMSEQVWVCLKSASDEAIEEEGDKDRMVNIMEVNSIISDKYGWKIAINEHISMFQSKDNDWISAISSKFNWRVWMFPSQQTIKKWYWLDDNKR